MFRVDYETTRDIDAQIDLQQLALTANAVDLVWCHQMLEHIEDDAAARRELNSLLRPDTGELVVSVPMTDAAATVEYGFPDPKESGHWRIYGDDFVTKLEASGFAVTKSRLRGVSTRSRKVRNQRRAVLCLSKTCG